MRRLWWIWFFLLLFSCNRQTEAPSSFLEYDSKLWREGLGEWGSLSSVHCMVFSEGELFIVDYENNRIIRIDENLQKINQIGGPGQGPGEFEFPGSLYLTRDMLMAQTEGSQKLQVFSRQGDYEHMFRTPGAEWTRFFFWEGFFYFSTPKADHAISVYDVQGNIVRSFGDLYPSERPRESRARSAAYLCPVELDSTMFLVAISWTEAWVKLYDLAGNLLFEEDLSDHRELQERIDFRNKGYAEDPINRETSYSLFEDVYVRGDILYLLPYKIAPYTHLLNFKLSVAGLRELKTIRIPFDFEKFAVDDHETLYGYDREYSVLHRFGPK